MKKKICMIILLASIPCTGRCDLFGGDVALLSQLLSNSLQQLVQLRAILQNGRDDLMLLQQINAGINDSLRLAQTISDLSGQMGGIIMAASALTPTHVMSATKVPIQKPTGIAFAQMAKKYRSYKDKKDRRRDIGGY